MSLQIYIELKLYCNSSYSSWWWLWTFYVLFITFVCFNIYWETSQDFLLYILYEFIYLDSSAVLKKRLVF